MPPPSPSRVGSAALTCPLCGGPNACAVAATGSFDTPCWCRDTTFAADLLARVPVEQRGQVCICQRCAAPPLVAG